jgi:hypothetical protein
VAALLLTIGVGREWRLLHEDQGAWYTTLALSHLRLGLGATRAHDTTTRVDTGETSRYGHHPAAVALLVAGAFAITGSDAPAIARSVSIVFHLGSVALAFALLGRFTSPPFASAGALFFAVVPMSSYFGRQVGYEPICLFAILLQLLGWVRFRQSEGRGGLGLLAAGVVVGGLVDWPSFFFVAALAVLEVLDLRAGRTFSRAGLAVLLVGGAAAFAFDLLHLALAGALAEFGDVIAKVRPLGGSLGPVDSLLGHVEGYRRYFTHAGLVSALAVAAAVLRPRGRLARALGTDDPILERLLAVAFLAPLAYVLAAPAWADVHPYWKFYFLPYTAISAALVVGALAKGVSFRPRLFRSLLALFALEVAATSAYMLHLRHTRVNDVAGREIARIRQTYLKPSSAPSAP